MYTCLHCTSCKMIIISRVLPKNSLGVIILCQIYLIVEYHLLQMGGLHKERVLIGGVCADTGARYRSAVRTVLIPL
jgi:hypothetical protein